MLTVGRDRPSWALPSQGGRDQNDIWSWKKNFKSFRVHLVWTIEGVPYVLLRLEFALIKEIKWNPTQPARTTRVLRGSGKIPTPLGQRVSRDFSDDLISVNSPPCCFLSWERLPLFRDGKFYTQHAWVCPYQSWVQFLWCNLPAEGSRKLGIMGVGGGGERTLDHQASSSENAYDLASSVRMSPTCFHPPMCQCPSLPLRQFKTLPKFTPNQRMFHLSFSCSRPA